MKWYLINSGFNPGGLNMEIDINLANNCPADEAYFRLYRWKPYCISLGANQNLNDINVIKAFNDGIDVVKRPTGGRAILHAEELTYSLIYPLNNGYSPAEIYRRISSTLLKGLSIYNSKLDEAELEDQQPDFPKILKEPEGLACFAVTARSEVKWNGKKLIGSAQRKMDKIILQHGSILCGNYHIRIIDYLNLPDENIRIILKNLEEKTTDINTILNTATNYNKLSLALIKGFEQEWNIKFIEKNDYKGVA
jgi:lipoyl(octanoyl) transferase